MSAERKKVARKGSVPGRVSRLGWLTLAGMVSAAAMQQSVAANPVHPNPTGERDEATVVNRGDVVKLPAPLKRTLGELAEGPHSVLPLQAFAEADKPSQLFQSYLLDTKNFQPNVFTAIVPGRVTVIATR